MTHPVETPAHVHCEHHRSSAAGFCNGTYGLGIIGAAIYFIQNATGFWNGALGLLKAIVWPAILIYQALEFLGK